MYHWLDEPRYPHEGVVVPTLWLTIALSLLLHLAALLFWLPQTKLFAASDETTDRASDRLQVRLAAIVPPAPPPAPAQARAPEPRAAPGATAPPAKTALRAPSRAITPKVEAPVIALAPKAESSLRLPPPAPPTPPAPPSPSATPTTSAPSSERLPDLWAYVQARRQARGEPDAPAVSDESARVNAAIAANLPEPANGVAARDKKRAGGVFQIRRMDYDDAAFEFYGWNPDMQRKTPQLIEVRKGNNSDMRIAVVRRMIEVIRENSKNDFVWRSIRRDRDYVLSARLSDNAGLEDFLMHEFFDDPQQVPSPH